MKKNILTIGILALVILLIPLASANADVNPSTNDNMLSKSYTFATNESTSKVLAKVYGTNITIAEFMEKVYPGSLKVLPKDTVARYQKTQMIWPNPQEVKKASAGKEVVITAGKDVVTTSSATPSVIRYGVGCISTLTLVKSSKKAGFTSSTKVKYPTTSTTIPEISVMSYLFKDSGTTPIASATSVGYNTNYQIAIGEAGLSTGTHSYYTHGTHFMVWPIGCAPPTTTGISVSDTQSITI